MNEISKKFGVVDGYAEAVYTDRLEVSLINISPKTKDRLGLHYHQKKESLFIVLEGKAKVIVNGEEVLLEPGTAVIVPPREKHYLFLGMIPADDKPLKLIAIGSPIEKGHTFVKEK